MYDELATILGLCALKKLKQVAVIEVASHSVVSLSCRTSYNILCTLAQT